MAALPQTQYIRSGDADIAYQVFGSIAQADGSNAPFSCMSGRVRTSARSA
jgi:hypothetical protein